MSTLAVDTIQNVAGTKAVPSADLVDGHCTAWVTFNGATVGTNAPMAGFNVSSVTRNASGDYTVTFVTPMANANFSTTACGNYNATTLQSSIHVISQGISSVQVASTLTGATTFQTWDAQVTLAVFGGK